MHKLIDKLERLKFKFLVGLIFLLFFLITALTSNLPAVYADNEFSSSYNINYEVDKSGITTVTEKITLKNLTDRFYASSFNLSIGATNVTEVAAIDAAGPLDITAQNQGKKTNIVVKFSQQVAGQGKQYPFTISFKSKDFAEAQGKIWQVSIPKISSTNNLDQFQLTLSVPVEFGDPTSILPEPVSQSESAGRINFNFSKDQLSQSGILANFGANQIFNFTEYDYLQNKGLLPVLQPVVIPSNTNYQKITIQSISPQPVDAYFDDDGNTIAQFKLDKDQKINVEVKGQAVLSLNANQPGSLTEPQLQAYLTSQKYWEKDNPVITTKLKDIFQGKNPTSIQDKAKLIYQFVVSDLAYDQDRVSRNDFTRLGALTVLNNPTQALCQEFSDLFVALTRAAGIPSRELTGYAYSSNTDIRPLSLRKNFLHAWVEYYDPDKGWVMVDPTWENTTGGVDYFAKFDLNHVTLATRGLSSEKPDPPSAIKMEFGDQITTASSQPKVEIFAPNQLFAGFPSKISVRISNNGNTATDSAQFKISAQKLNLINSNKSLNQSFVIPAIPPFGHQDYEFSANSTSPVEDFNDILEVKYGDLRVTKSVEVKPFLAFNLFSFGMLGIFLLIIGTYLFTVIFHLRLHRKLTALSLKRRS